MASNEEYLNDNPLWYKDAVIYQCHVKSFFDGNGDGIGDFVGLARKLDYIEDLGVTAIWLLPFYPSPMRDDGYDIADYYEVNPHYGTLDEFRAFLSEAHRRGIRVITELVLNHTSDQHPWFQKSRHAEPGSMWRNFYVWSDTKMRYADARIIFKDFETSNWTWDPVANAYYWHRFYFHQPDLNFDSPHVQEATLRVIDFWMEMGVDGVRLDAVPYLYEREGGNCENLPETHAYLKKLNEHVQSRFKNRMLLAEANQWPEDAVAYFGKGDECQMAFHFPLMPRIFMSIQMEDRFPITDIMEQTPVIPSNCQWAVFLRNHDELTLEMVTDEERDYMYRVYAQDPQARINLGIRRRLAPLVENNRRKIELMHALLFSITGTPVLYYGDEIGMGDNFYLGDRNGVRTPMQWSPDRNAGFSPANSQRLFLPIIIDPEYHYESVNVDNQEHNTSSLLWWMRRKIALRRRYKAFGHGTLEFISPDNPKILAFIRKFGEEEILIISNLSQYPQVATLQLGRYAGCVPEEISGQNKFPPIKKIPYTFMVGGYDYYWLVLRRPAVIAGTESERLIPQLAVGDSWRNIFRDKYLNELEETLLPTYLRTCSWFGTGIRGIREVRVLENLSLSSAEDGTVLLLQAEYFDHPRELLCLPLAFTAGVGALEVLAECPQAIVARLQVGLEEGVLYDAVFDERMRRALLALIETAGEIRGIKGVLAGKPASGSPALREPGAPLPTSIVVVPESRNSVMVFENTSVLKLFRRLEPGINPDSEMVRFFSEETDFRHAPGFGGTLEYARPGEAPMVTALMEAYVPSQGDAWLHSLNALNQYVERLLSRRTELRESPKLIRSLWKPESESLTRFVEEIMGGVYPEFVRLLGIRTAEMHLALWRSTRPDFAPEPFTQLYQRSVYQSIRNGVGKALVDLQKNLSRLTPTLQKEARHLLSREKQVLQRLSPLLELRFHIDKTRLHGDYHLGQVLYTGKDFVVIDFDAQAGRSLSERRLKRSPLLDVASMIRSFHYAAYTALFRHVTVSPEDRQLLEPWMEAWFHHMAGIFWRAYRDTAGETRLLPVSEEARLLLNVFLMEREAWELRAELNKRPEWAVVPIRGLTGLLD